MSIASEISRLLQAKADIKIAIEGKGVTVSGSATLDDYSDLIDAIQQGSEPNLQSKSVAITENGTTTVEPDTGYDGLSDVEVSVNVQGGGGGGASSGDDVRFFDYDGTILHSYSASDFLALTEMPENPTHTGLTSQGWNWSLSDAKAQVQAMGSCDIGQMYITDDGKTRIYIELQEGILAPYLGICPNGSVEVDWGDGSATNTLTGYSLTSVQQVQHTYASAGSYVITLTVVSGTFALYGTDNNAHILRKSTSNSSNISKAYSNAVRKVFLGTSVQIKDYAFHYCTSLESITIPNSITQIGRAAFQYCYHLKAITIPSGVSEVAQYMCQYCYLLAIASIPHNITDINGYSFAFCANIKRIVIPSGVTYLGSSVFYSAYALESIVLPDGLTSIGSNVFSSCQSLTSLILPSRATNISGLCNNCQSIKSVTITGTPTEISGNAFTNCQSLATFTIPNSVTKIGNYAFNKCSSISRLTIPSGVTSIGNYAFGECYGMSEYHFLSTTPPTLGGSYVFQYIPSDCKIYVPAEALEDYKAAQYWSTHASKMVGE